MTHAAAQPVADQPADLPEWDLSDLYRSTDDPELATDLKTAEAEAKAFAGRYQGVWRVWTATPSARRWPSTSA